MQKRVDSLYIIGICGRLTGSIAIFARDQGCKVSGCDWRKTPPVGPLLDKHGIEVTLGYDPDHMLSSRPDLIIIGGYSKRGDPILEAVLKSGIRYLSAAEFIGEFMLQDKWVLAVTGTHGKTTTTSMVAHILRQTGREPSFIIGGLSESLGEFFHYNPKSPYFVIEGDEYRTSFYDSHPKFRYYHPKTLIMNNLEEDHSSQYPNIESLENTFYNLTRLVPQDGLLIHPQESESLHRVCSRGVQTPIETFGHQGRWTSRPLSRDGSSFEVLKDEKVVARVQWSLFGSHQVLNALASIAAANHIGIEPSEAAAALNTFKGTIDRLTNIGSKKGGTVWLDFGYHPTSIGVTLKALRDHLGKEARIVAGIPTHVELKWGDVYKYGLVKAVEPTNHSIIYGLKKTDHSPEFEGAIEEVPPLSRVPVETCRDPLIYEQLLLDQASPETHYVLFWTYMFGQRFPHEFLEKLDFGK